MNKRQDYCLSNGFYIQIDGIAGETGGCKANFPRNILDNPTDSFTNTYLILEDGLEIYGEKYEEIKINKIGIRPLIVSHILKHARILNISQDLIVGSNNIPEVELNEDERNQEKQLMSILLGMSGKCNDENVLHCYSVLTSFLESKNE